MACADLQKLPPDTLSSPAVKRESQPYLSPAAADLIAGFSSIVAGGLTFWRVTEERAYKNLSSLGMWDDLKPARKIRGTEILKQVESGSISAKSAHHALKDAVHAGEALADKRLAALGSSGILEQFNLLRGHQKWEVVISTLAVSGIALGSILLLSRQLFQGKAEETPQAKSMFR